MGLDQDSVKGKMVWQEYEPKIWTEDDVDSRCSQSKKSFFQMWSDFSLLFRYVSRVNDWWNIVSNPELLPHEAMLTQRLTTVKITHCGICGR